MSFSLVDALSEHTRSRRRIAQIVRDVTGDDEAEDARLTKRQIGRIIDREFPKKRGRENDALEEGVVLSEEEEEPTSFLREDCRALEALTYMYTNVDRNDPYASILYGKMRRVAERIEPTEEQVQPNLDTIVVMSDRIRHFFPDRAELPELETLFEIGRKAKEYHIQVYGCPPSKQEREDGKWVNVYTEETAPETLDRAIREVLNQP